jgi:predicted dehydrogenase
VGVVRFGFVGAGEIAVASADAVDEAPSATLAAVFDVDAGLAAELAERHMARVVTLLDDVLTADDVDAVYVCVPHALHRQVATRAASAGKHVYVEKPMGVSVQDAQAIVAACDRHHVACGVAFVARYAPAFVAARDLVASGAVGDVTGFRIAYRGDKPASYWTGGWTGRAAGDWRTRWSTAGGGVLLMNAIHDLDALLWITGLEIRRVQGAISTSQTPTEVEDAGVAILEAAGGALGTVEALAALPGGEAPDARWVDRVYGIEGQILLPTPWGTDGLAVYRRAEDGWSEIRPGASADARASAFEAFSTAVLDGIAPPVNGHDGLRASRLIHAVYDAARSGRPVEIVERS